MQPHHWPTTVQLFSNSKSNQDGHVSTVVFYFVKNWFKISKTLFCSQMFLCLKKVSFKKVHLKKVSLKKSIFKSIYLKKVSFKKITKAVPIQYFRSLRTATHGQILNRHCSPPLYLSLYFPIFLFKIFFFKDFFKRYFF